MHSVQKLSVPVDVSKLKSLALQLEKDLELVKEAVVFGCWFHFQM